MARKRLSLVHYDLLRELCESCRRERFHFVPIGAVPAEGPCRNCGAEARMADLSDSSIYRLVAPPNSDAIQIATAPVCTPVTTSYRMPSSSWKKKKKAAHTSRIQRRWPRGVMW